MAAFAFHRMGAVATAFRRSEHGAAAVEFGFVILMMPVIVAGALELTHLSTTTHQGQLFANAVGQIVSRASTFDEATMTQAYKTAFVMVPNLSVGYPVPAGNPPPPENWSSLVNDVDVTVSAIEFVSTGGTVTGKVLWSYASNPIWRRCVNSAVNRRTPGSAPMTNDIPQDLFIEGKLISVEVIFHYNSLIGASRNIVSTAYFNVRPSSQIVPAWTQNTLPVGRSQDPSRLGDCAASAQFGSTGGGNHPNGIRQGGGRSGESGDD